MVFFVIGSLNLQIFKNGKILQKQICFIWYAAFLRENKFCRIFLHLRSLDSTDKSLHYHTMCVVYLFVRGFPGLLPQLFVCPFCSNSSSPIPLRTNLIFVNHERRRSSEGHYTMRERVLTNVNDSSLHSAPKSLKKCNSEMSHWLPQRLKVNVLWNFFEQSNLEGTLSLAS